MEGGFREWKSENTISSVRKSKLVVRRAVRRLFLDRGRPSRGLSRLSHTELGIDFGPAE
jgi:hypothetical protein